ncbi:transposase domain-containing protein [Streptomyces kaempferi]|uniref:Transposase domain-containing protein n=1 Tax=Streptomyces kaempferi TaxID=333725 RepID=A0ABW3XX74_9ACTN
MGLLSRTFPPELVDFVVDEAGAREERTRSLPSRLTVYFVLAMWLFTGYEYGLVLPELVEHWPRRARETWRPARTGSLTEARQRVGPGPLRLLFDRVSGASGTAATPGAFWRGLRLVSMDGSLFDVPAARRTPPPTPVPPTATGPAPSPRCGYWPWWSAAPRR